MKYSPHQAGCFCQIPGFIYLLMFGLTHVGSSLSHGLMEHLSGNTMTGRAVLGL